MDGENLNIHGKNYSDFRKYNHTLTVIKWITPLSVQLKNNHEEFVLEDQHTDHKFIVDTLKYHGFIANTTYIIKLQNTDKPMPRNL